MEFTIKRTELKKALAGIQGCIDVGKGHNVLTSIAIETVGDGCVRFMASNIDITGRCEAVADVSGQGAACVEGKKLVGVAGAVTGETVRFATEGGGRLLVASGSSKYRFPVMGFDEFPVMPALSPSVVTIAGDTLKTLLQKSRFATDDQDASNPTLAGVRTEISPGSIRFLSANSHGVVRIDEPCNAETTDEFTLPVKAAAEAMRFEGEDVGIANTTNHIIFSSESRVIVARKLAGRYPNYQAIIPLDCNNRVRFDCKTMGDAIRRASLMSQDELQTMAFAVGSDGITITVVSASAGDAEEFLACRYEGEPFEIGFAWTEFLAFLSAAGDCGDIELTFKDVVTQVEMFPVDEPSYRFVIVPVQLAVARATAANQKAQRAA